MHRVYILGSRQFRPTASGSQTEHYLNPRALTSETSWPLCENLQDFFVPDTATL